MSSPPFSARANALVQRIEHWLEHRLSALPDDRTRLPEAMRYATLNGGKRLRPLLVYASGEALGLTPDRLDGAAAAVELIHCYSLVHDDLPAMDDDSLRRGQPTTHIAFDEATAILAGDALQALAFEVLAETSEPAAACRMSLELTRACGAAGMAGGQALDLQFERQQPERAAVESMYAKKTGALIHAAVMLPAALRPDLPDDHRRALSDFAHAAGLGFQIRDDLLEIEGDTQVIGKSSHSDQVRQKASWPALFGAGEARARIDELTLESRHALERLPGDHDGLCWLAERLLRRQH
ncbi:MAG TPA: farnesyl diphosphate synthase [Wenzhouxiangella sp.]|nr:farnesyl diphosphate synthase [Wenzhouxiangella sp.]